MKGQTNVVVLALLVALLAIVALIFGIWKCCDGDPGTGDSALQLVVEDSHSAVWGPIDNGFAENDTSWSKWDGVLFQVGTFYQYAQDEAGDWQRQPWVEFNKIVIEGSSDSTPVELVAGDFTWLNIVSHSTGNTVDPLPLEFADLLFPNNRVDYECKIVDDCAIHTGAAATACTDTLDKVLRPCVRRRSLHSTFEPSAIVTYWHGAQGYELAVLHNSMKHDEFAFDLLDRIAKVEVFLMHVCRKMKA